MVSTDDPGPFNDHILLTSGLALGGTFNITARPGGGFDWNRVMIGLFYGCRSGPRVALRPGLRPRSTVLSP